MILQNDVYDVIVVGGGPAGSTTAAILHEKGWKVALFEKDVHPRFHIGESLLPMSIPLLQQLGVYEKVEAVGNCKRGASFFLDKFDFYCSYFFKNALNKGQPSAFQIKRADFDNILFNNAKDKGVETTENATVTAIEKQLDGMTKVTVKQGDLENIFQCRFVVDASGRDTFLGNKSRHKRSNPKHKSAAIFAHFDHCRGFPELANGNIGIYWFEHGWIWLIPFRDGSVSVGAVCNPEFLKTRRGDLDGFLYDIIAQSSYLSSHLADAKIINNVQATGNYSYFCDEIYGDNYLLVGDAFAFVDPVFSSGVHVALRSSFKAADTIDGLLRNPKQRSRYLRQYQKFVMKGIRGFTWMIYHMLKPDFQYLFMRPRNMFRLEEAIISILSGDVFDKTPLRPRFAVFKCIYYVSRIFRVNRRTVK